MVLIYEYTIILQNQNYNIKLIDTCLFKKYFKQNIFETLKSSGIPGTEPLTEHTIAKLNFCKITPHTIQPPSGE